MVKFVFRTNGPWVGCDHAEVIEYPDGTDIRDVQEDCYWWANDWYQSYGVEHGDEDEGVEVEIDCFVEVYDEDKHEGMF